MRKSLLYTIILLLFVSYTVSGQAGQSVEKLTNGKVNDSGSAVTYFLTSNGVTSLNLYNVKNRKLMQFEGIHPDMVLNDKIWMGWNFKERTLTKVDLKTWTKETTTGVDRYQWLPETGRILFFNGVKKTLQLWDESSKNLYELSEIHSYEVSPNNNLVLVVLEENRTVLLKLDRKDIKEVSLKSVFPAKEIKKIKWNPFDLQFYLFTADSQKIDIFRITDKDVTKLATTPLADTEQSYIDTTFRNLEFLDKDQIIMGIKPIVKPDSNSVSQIWLGSSKGITPKIRKAYANNLQAAIMSLSTGKKTSLFEAGKINIFKIHPNSRTVYGYEKNELEDFTKQYPAIRVYEYDLEKGKKNLLGEFRGHSSYFITSNLESYLFYFKGGEWFKYNDKTKKTTHITEGMKHKFYDARNEFIDGADFIPNQQLPSYKNKWLVFESLSDIWFYDPSSNEFQQKTDGIKQKRKYSVIASSKKTIFNNLYWSENVKIINKDILLSWQSDNYEDEGLSLLKENGDVEDIIKTKGSFSQVMQSKRTLTYVKERADFPPALYILDKNSHREELLYQTNKTDTLVPQTKYIHWLNKQGEQRGAVVRFPKNYDPIHTYPAVVNIYQKKYMSRNEYAHISQQQSGSINYRQYTEDGYFVIEPDIYYELGATGQSAYMCVNDALDQVLSQTSIDPNRIGIIGHSFGGYETNFILTQTDRFKAAVSSAGVFDLESMYLTMNLETFKPDMWRMENQQFRIGQGMYDDRELYRNNSPSVFVENITTPVLIVTGGKDYQVNYQQSYMMFLALKRLNKEVNLLLYPSEAHTMETPGTRIDYNEKIKEWFDYKLKEIRKPEWLKEGLP